MTKSRARLFDDDTDVDLSEFKPKTASDPSAPPAEQVRAVAEAANFRSREPAQQPVTRPPRRYRTGRTSQLSIRATPQTVEEFYAIADQQNWKAGETLERALAALKRETAARQ